MGHLLGYARVSTTDQTADGQTDALRAERVFVDKASGKLDSRPELDKVLDRLLPGDTVIVGPLQLILRTFTGSDLKAA